MAKELTNISNKVLHERYLLRDRTGEVVETIPELWVRVANHVALAEKPADREVWEAKFLARMENLDFLPNTPTIMNAGKDNGQLSACFVLPIEDSMEGIFTTLKDAAIVHQTGGGTGFDFSGLRPEGSMVSNKSGVSTGPLAFCQVYDKATEVIKQGASRRGANMMTLRVDHPDILNFIRMKRTPGVMTNFNVSVLITDEFMDALATGKTYVLTHPYTGYVRQLSAKLVWDEIANCAHSSAEPGIIFIDRVNEKSSYHEECISTNPCGEIPLPAYGACNLGSINLSNFVQDGAINFLALVGCVHDAVRFLDDVIDVNHYPLPEISAFAEKYRNIGLGVMGWADALIKMNIPYNSDKAIELGHEVQEFINVVAHSYSTHLGREKGLPSGAPFRSPFDYASSSRRNATLTTVAPTGTISMIAGCSSGIEPVFAFEMTRNQLDQTFTDYHPLWKQHLDTGNTYLREAFVEASEVSPKYHVIMQAAFQENVCSSISKTINLPSDASIEDVKEAYLLAWQTGCKGITVYRDGSRGVGVLSKIEKKESSCCDDPVIVVEAGCETCKSCGVSKCAVA